MAENSRDTLEQCSDYQPAKEETSTVASRLGLRESFNNDEDIRSGGSEKGEEDEDHRETSESAEKDQTAKEKVNLVL